MDIYDRIRDLGPRFDPEVLRLTRSLFQPLWDQTAADDVKVEWAAYGNDERHVADIYRTEGEGKPMLVFLPGGGFVGGSRTEYQMFGTTFARRGFVVIIADYRLAPTNQWPAGSVDVSTVVDWAFMQGATFGGDRQKIVVFGHSAGATHVATALFDRRFQPACVNDVYGVALKSGVYQVDTNESRENLLAYYGTDGSQYPDRAPLFHVEGTKKNLLVMLSQYEPLPFVRSAAALLVEYAKTRKRTSEFFLADRHNHISAIFGVGTVHDSIGPVLERFVMQ